MIQRPDIVSKYFEEGNNVVDIHNQSRQGDLHLEKCWPTTDGFFRLFTTIFGVCVTDSWQAYRFHLENNHRHKKNGILEFAKILCRDMLENSYSKDVDSDNALIIDVDENQEQNQHFSQDSSSALTRDSRNAESLSVSNTFFQNSSFFDEHMLVLANITVPYSIKVGKSKKRSGNRKLSGKCMICN